MKKGKIFLYILLSLVILFCAGKVVVPKIIASNESLSVKTMISTYEKNKTHDNLYNLCKTLSLTSNFEEKKKYFEIFVFEGCAEIIAEKEYYNSTYKKQVFIDEYKYEYFLTLVHLNEFDEFKKTYQENVVDITGQNLFYSVLFYELNNFEWTDEQLLFLENILNEDTNKDFFDDDLLFENTCLRTKVYEMTNNEKLEKNNSLIYEYIKQNKE